MVGPVFVARLHAAAWNLAGAAKRAWIAAELAAVLVAVLVTLGCVAGFGRWDALRWHFSAMLAGECLTGFFAVWTVHRGCDPGSQPARTQRGFWFGLISYGMFFHAEHHAYPRVPTGHLAILARRMDAAMARIPRKHVVGRASGRAGEPAVNAPGAGSGRRGGGVRPGAAPTGTSRRLR